MYFLYLPIPFQKPTWTQPSQQLTQESTRPQPPQLTQESDRSQPSQSTVITQASQASSQPTQPSLPIITCQASQSSHPQKSQISTNTSKPEVPCPAELVVIRNESSSRRNFAKNVATRAYSEEKRKSSNVKGKVGKNQLSPTRMEGVKKAVFCQFPLEGWENEKDA